MINKLSNISRKVFTYPGEDKKDHFILGVLAMALLFTLLPTDIRGIGIAVTYSFALGFGIEGWQWLTKTGKFELWDAVAVMAGSAFVYLPALPLGLPG